MVDRELLSKIENDMPSYMANSPARVREFLGVWERHCNETITLVKGVEGVEDLMRDETELLSRIRKLKQYIRDIDFVKSMGKDRGFNLSNTDAIQAIDHIDSNCGNADRDSTQWFEACKGYFV
jgi:hypothetical protein